MIGSIITMLGFDLPSWVPELFGPDLTAVIFAAIGSIITLFQFVKTRVGKSGDVLEYSAGKRSIYAYALNPFKSA